MRERIVITGVGVLSPNGAGKEAFRDAVRAGRSGIRRIEHLDIAKLHTRVAGRIDNGILDSLLPDPPQPLPDRTALLALIGAKMAWADARLEDSAAPHLRRGVILGCAAGAVEQVERFYGSIHDKDAPYPRPSTIQGMQPHNAADLVARQHALEKVCMTVSAGGVSSFLALARACELLETRRADIMLVGGVECPLVQHYYRSWDSLRLLTRDYNHDPQGASRPFDQRRSGMVLSEACGFVVLEREEVAIERNATAYAQVLGIGESTNARSPFDPQPEPLAECMAEALADARLEGQAVDHLQAHAASLPQHDAIEARAIAEVFGDMTPQVAVSSIKSMIGHTLGASGIMSLVAVLLGMQDRFVAPVINLEAPDADSAALELVPYQAHTLEIFTAMVNNFGLGGSNVSVVLGNPTQ